VILTRDRELVKNNKVTCGLRIISQFPEQQCLEVFQHFDLKNKIHPFTRCLECNHPLAEVSREKIVERLLPNTRQYYREFKVCLNCDHIYWKGSHYVRMKQFLDQIVESC
jgi:uncharacterized protein with PIN domain